MIMVSFQPKDFSEPELGLEKTLWLLLRTDNCSPHHSSHISGKHSHHKGLKQGQNLLLTPEEVGKKASTSPLIRKEKNMIGSLWVRIEWLQMTCEVNKVS